MMNDGYTSPLFGLPRPNHFIWRWPRPAGFTPPPGAKKARRKRKLAKASKKRNRKH